MPSYEYVCSCGNEMEKEFSMSNMKSKVKCNKCGKMAKRAFRNRNAIIRHSFYDRSRGAARVGRGRGF